MTGASCAVVPLGASPEHFADTHEALRRLQVPFHIELQPDSLATRKWTDVGLVIVQGAATPRMVQLVRGLAAAHHNVRVLVFARHLTDDFEATLLHEGAYDVLGMPASRARIEARVRAGARQLGLHDEALLLLRGALTIDLGRREVAYQDSPLQLTKTEFNLLALLAQRPRHVLSRDELASQAIGRDYTGPRALESHLSRLRAKIQLVGGPRLVEPVRGVGYRLGVL